MGGNRNADTDAWFDRHDNPQKGLVQADALRGLVRAGIEPKG